MFKVSSSNVLKPTPRRCEVYIYFSQAISILPYFVWACKSLSPFGAKSDTTLNYGNRSLLLDACIRLKPQALVPFCDDPLFIARAYWYQLRQRIHFYVFNAD